MQTEKDSIKQNMEIRFLIFVDISSHKYILVHNQRG